MRWDSIRTGHQERSAAPSSLVCDARSLPQQPLQQEKGRFGTNTGVDGLINGLSNAYYGIWATFFSACLYIVLCRLVMVMMIGWKRCMRSPACLPTYLSASYGKRSFSVVLCIVADSVFALGTWLRENKNIEYIVKEPRQQEEEEEEASASPPAPVSSTTE